MYYQLLNATADYKAGPYSVTFPAWTTFIPLSVILYKDDVVEGNENFILSINQSSLPDNITTDNHGQTTVTIFDDDCKFCQ